MCDYSSLQAPTEGFKVVLKEAFGGEEGLSFFFLSCLLDQLVQIFIFRLALFNNCLFIANADCPTLWECIRFQGRERRINIPQEIGSNYYYLGLHLRMTQTEQEFATWNMTTEK